MSMRSSFIYGYGFKCDFSEDKLIEFVKLHKETFCKIAGKDLYEEVANIESSELGELLSNYDYCCDNTGMEGMGAIVSNIISEETHIS